MKFLAFLVLTAPVAILLGITVEQPLSAVLTVLWSFAVMALLAL